jgi:hypothetical protein
MQYGSLYLYFSIFTHNILLFFAIINSHLFSPILLSLLFHLAFTPFSSICSLIYYVCVLIFHSPFLFWIRGLIPFPRKGGRNVMTLKAHSASLALIIRRNTSSSKLRRSGWYPKVRCPHMIAGVLRLSVVAALMRKAACMNMRVALMRKAACVNTRTAFTWLRKSSRARTVRSRSSINSRSFCNEKQS